MGKRNLVLVIGILTLGVTLSLAPGAGVAQQEVTVVGVINDIGQLVDDGGELYEIADTEMGVELMELSGQKVSATGTVLDADGTKIITVTYYETLD